MHDSNKVESIEVEAEEKHSLRNIGPPLYKHWNVKFKVQ